MSTKKWAVMTCEDCGTFFAFFAIEEEPNFQICVKCGSEETQGTGEYLDGTLYTEDGHEN